MKNIKISTNLTMGLLLAASVGSLQAADVSVKCDKKSLADAISKLDPAETNTVNITSDCNEDIVISGHANLTMIGSGGASITASVIDPGLGLPLTNAVTVENSKVTLQNLTVNAGNIGVACTHSNCVLRDVNVVGGQSGVTAQDQTDMDIFGSSSITGSQGTGVAAYGASNINIKPNWYSGFDPAEAGPVISGHGFAGAWAQDGSFLRADNVEFTNNWVGIWAQRNATLKIYSQPDAGLAGVSNNSGSGIVLASDASAHIGLPINDNPIGIEVGPLSVVQSAGATFSNNPGGDILCLHSTSVDYNFGICP